MKRTGCRVARLIWALSLPALAAMNIAWAAEPALDVEKLISKEADAYMQAPQTVGLSIGVIHDAKVYRHHVGRVSKDSANKPNDQTIYPIASLTKTFAGLLLAQAAVDKKLALDDDVRKYLGAGYDNLSYEGQPVRLYHLLNHRSGLPFALSTGSQNSKDEFRAQLRNVKLTNAPGIRFQYSNAAAQLAGYILENAYGQSFESLLRARIAVPLGLRDLAITLSPDQQTRLVVGYDESGIPQPLATDHAQAAGALKATLDDLLAYAQLQLNEKDAAVRLSRQPTYVSDNYSVGLNWQMLTERGRRVIWQDGAIPGFASLFVLQPEAGTAVVLLSNELDRQTLGRLRVLANAIAQNLDNASIAVP